MYYLSQFSNQKDVKTHFLPIYRSKKGQYCAVYKCHNRTGRVVLYKGTQLRFYNVIRKDLAQTALWIDAIRRKNLDGTDWKPTKQSVICGAHFVTGRFSKEVNSPDYCPKQFPKEYRTQSKTEDDIARHERVRHLISRFLSMLHDIHTFHYSFTVKKLFTGGNYLRKYGNWMQTI